jgi:twinkle protein
LLGYDSAMAYLSDPATPDMDKGCLLVAVGELDLLAFYQIGIRNVVALPSSSMHQHADSMAAAAPAAGTAAPSRPPSSSPSSALAALDSCTELLDSDRFPQITIAPPNTQAGFALGEELARRLGKERCYRLVWPSSPQDNPRLRELADAWPQAAAQQADAGQDAAGEVPVTSDADASQVDSAAREADQQQEASSSSSMAIEPPLLWHPASPDPGYRMSALEVLAYDGSMFLQYLRDVNTVEYPVQGLHSFADFWGEIYEYYMQQRPYETGVSSGWEALDQYYRVVPGELTVVTGVPNSGKSEWLDALLVNLSRDNNWSFAMCSFEKSVSLCVSGGLLAVVPASWTAAAVCA